MTVSIEVTGMLMTLSLILGLLVGNGRGPTMFRALCLPFKLLLRR